MNCFGITRTGQSFAAEFQVCLNRKFQVKQRGLEPRSNTPYRPQFSKPTCRYPTTPHYGCEALLQSHWSKRRGGGTKEHLYRTIGRLKSARHASPVITKRFKAEPPQSYRVFGFGVPVHDHSRDGPRAQHSDPCFPRAWVWIWGSHSGPSLNKSHPKALIKHRHTES